LVPYGKSASCTDAELQLAGGVPIPLLSLLAFTGIGALLGFTGHRRKQA